MNMRFHFCRLGTDGYRSKGELKHGVPLQWEDLILSHTMDVSPCSTETPQKGGLSFVH